MSDITDTIGKLLRPCRLQLGRPSPWRVAAKDKQPKAAETFDADADVVKLSQKVFDNEDAEFQRAISIVNAAEHFWKSRTRPFPQDGVRLIRRTDVASFREGVEERQRELAAALDALAPKWADKIKKFKERTGQLSDKVAVDLDVRDRIYVRLSWPRLSEVDEDLRLEDSKAYEQEKSRIQAELRTASEMFREQMASEFSELVAKLSETVSGVDAQGNRRKFSTAAVTNIREFFARFRELDLGDDQMFSTLVARAEKAVGGSKLDDLKGDQHVRDRVRAAFDSVGRELSGLVESRKRKIDLVA